MKINKNKGITLIALVVTIIVLLILAGVTLTLALNNNGIIGRSKNAVAAYQEAEMLELSEFDNLEKMLELTLVDAFKQGNIKVGDYLNYEAIEEKTFITEKTGTDTSNGIADQTFWVKDNKNKSGSEIKWRVLGLGNDKGELVDNGNHLLLVADKSVERSEIDTEGLNIDSQVLEMLNDAEELMIYGAESVVNNERILNGISEIYINEEFASGARSIRIEDLNYLIGIVADVDNGVVYQKNNPEKNIEDDGYGGKYIGKVYNFKEGEEEGTVYNLLTGEEETKMIKESTPESYLKGMSAIEDGVTSVKGDGYAYGVHDFFDQPIGHTTVKDLINTDTYFFPSHKALVSTDSVNWGAGYYYTTTNYANREVGIAYATWLNFSHKGPILPQSARVRPVIILKPELTVKDLLKQKREFASIRTNFEDGVPSDMNQFSDLLGILLPDYKFLHTACELYINDKHIGNLVKDHLIDDENVELIMENDEISEIKLKYPYENNQNIKLDFVVEDGTIKIKSAELGSEEIEISSMEIKAIESDETYNLRIENKAGEHVETEYLPFDQSGEITHILENVIEEIVSQDTWDEYKFYLNGQELELSKIEGENGTEAKLTAIISDREVIIYPTRF